MMNILKTYFRSFKQGLQNLWKWKKIIYKDRDWDYSYIFEILIAKLEFQAKYLREYSYHTSANYDASKIMLCVKLLERVQSEYYLDEAFNAEGLTKESWDKAIARHDKAKRLAFKILERYIERWWD